VIIAVMRLYLRRLPFLVVKAWEIACHQLNKWELYGVI
jgi:hypothetical protein